MSSSRAVDSLALRQSPSDSRDIGITAPNRAALEVLEKRLANVEQQFRVATLQLHATTAENEILKQNIGILQHRIESAEAVLLKLQLRQIVRIYRRVRMYFPDCVMNKPDRVINALAYATGVEPERLAHSPT